MSQTENYQKVETDPELTRMLKWAHKDNKIITTAFQMFKSYILIEDDFDLKIHKRLENLFFKKRPTLNF